MSKSHFTVSIKHDLCTLAIWLLFVMVYHVKCQKVVGDDWRKYTINVSNKQAIKSIKVLYKSVDSCQVLE